MMALTQGAETPERCFGRGGCDGGCYSDCGGRGGLFGGGLFGRRKNGHGCNGYNGCNGGYGCYGGGYGGGYGCYSGGYGGGYGCSSGGYGGGYGCYASGYSGGYGGGCASSYGGYGVGCAGGYGVGGVGCGGVIVPSGGVITPGTGGEKPKTDDKPKGDGPPKVGKATSTATLVVTLPEDAKLTIDGVATTSTSSRRVFITPELNVGTVYFYNLKAEVVREGKPVVMQERVEIRPGLESSVTLQPPTSVAAR
jgi:uncharacterized protein (TIGR03000 family)